MSDAAPSFSSEQEAVLYRAYTRKGKLLYIGISLSVMKRLAQHKKSSAWYRKTGYIVLDWMPSRVVAEEIEAKAIRQERPEFNKTHNVYHIAGIESPPEPPPPSMPPPRLPPRYILNRMEVKPVQPLIPIIDSERQAILDYLIRDQIGPGALRWVHRDVIEKLGANNRDSHWRSFLTMEWKDPRFPPISKDGDRAPGWSPQALIDFFSLPAITFEPSPSEKRLYLEHGYLYVIISENRNIAKLGVSRDPDGTLSRLKLTTNIDDLKLLGGHAYIDIDLKSYVEFCLSDAHIVDGWYRLDAPGVKDMIDDLLHKRIDTSYYGHHRHVRAFQERNSK